METWLVVLISALVLIIVVTFVVSAAFVVYKRNQRKSIHVASVHTLVPTQGQKQPFVQQGGNDVGYKQLSSTSESTPPSSPETDWSEEDENAEILGVRPFIAD